MTSTADSVSANSPSFHVKRGALVDRRLGRVFVTGQGRRLRDTPEGRSAVLAYDGHRSRGGCEAVLLLGGLRDSRRCVVRAAACMGRGGKRDLRGLRGVDGVA